MSTEVSIQNRAADASRGSGRRGGKARGGRGNNRSPRSDKAAKGPEALAISENDTDAVTVSSVTVNQAATQPLSPSSVSETSEDICWICAEPVKYWAVSECNHRTCHVCAIRLRALYKKLECTFCKEKQNMVIFTTSSNTLFESFKPENIPHKDTRLAVSFETQEMMEDSLLLLRFNCPEEQCDYMGNGWGDLRLHVRASHGKLICDLCVRFKKVFSHEHTLYLPGTLPIHLPLMPGRPSKAALKEAVEGGIHPLCEFCRECFFSDDELYAHMREKHEECFICKRNGHNHKYFRNYDSLERHFNSDHHACSQSECLARKFVVFNTELDLKAHMVEQHGSDMSSKDRKDARRIQADFAFEEVRSRTDRRDRDRERNREPPPRQQPPPPPPPQPSGSGARPPPTGVSKRREAFGGALTDPNPTQASSSNAATPRPGSPQQPATEVDPAVAERHAAFLSRLQSLAPNPTNAVPAVKAATRSYRSSESSARDLILTVWNVLDRNLEHTASIINGFVDLVEEEEKKADILTSWKGFAIEQRRQLPDLVPSEIGSGYAGITSGRIINAKHATASRASQSQQVWNRVAAAASSSSNLLPPPGPAIPANKPKETFPALGGGGGGGPSATPSFRTGQRKTPWSASSSQPTSLRVQPMSVSPAIRSNGPSKAPPKISQSAFPDLPTSSGSRSKVQVSGNVSLKNIMGGSTAPAVSAWSAAGNGGGGDNQVAASNETPATDAAAGGKGKRSKGKQKQTLFTLGAFPS